MLPPQSIRLYVFLSSCLRSIILEKDAFNQRHYVCRAELRRTLARGRLALTPKSPLLPVLFPSPPGWGFWLSQRGPGGCLYIASLFSVPSSATARRACEIISAESLILYHTGQLRFRKGKDLPQFTIVPFRGRKGTSILILRLPETLATSWLLPNTSWFRYSALCLYTSITAGTAPSEHSRTCISVNTLARDCASCLISL